MRRRRGGAGRPAPAARTTGDRSPTDREAILYSSHHSSTWPDPAYWVAPRHLAGDDGELAERISDILTSIGWRNWPTARSTLLHASPDGLRGAEWLLASTPFEVGGLPVAWQVSARPYPDSAVREWNAYFTVGTTYEALADFLLALDARPEPAVGFDTTEAVLAALSGRGWVRDIDHPATAASDPAFTAGFSWCLLPPLIEDAALENTPFGWQARAEPVLGAPYLWCAAFSSSTPHHLVAAFASSLASPAPVPRRLLPEGTADHLTFTPRE